LSEEDTNPESVQSFKEKKAGSPNREEGKRNKKDFRKIIREKGRGERVLLTEKGETRDDKNLQEGRLNTNHFLGGSKREREESIGRETLEEKGGS